MLFHSFRFGALRKSSWAVLSPPFPLLSHLICSTMICMMHESTMIELEVSQCLSVGEREGGWVFIDRLSAECSVWCLCQWISAPHKEREKKEWGAIWARVPNSFFQLTGCWYPSPVSPCCFTWRLIESGRARLLVLPFPASFNISWLPFYIGVGNQEVRRSVSEEAQLHHWTWQSRTTDKPWVW